MKDKRFAISTAGALEKTMIHSLLQTHLDELSKFPGEDMPNKDPNGIYLYRYFDAYWQESERFPYLLHIDDAIAGFALVRKAIEADGRWGMAEFYVKPEFRRQGLGEETAIDIIRKHPGDWRIKYNKLNTPGSRLWRKVAEILVKDKALRCELDVNHEYLSFSV